MINWLFKINNQEVEEPIGWDAVELTLQRSDTYLGLENIYSDNILFWNNGADIINAAYEAQSIDADLLFESLYDCGDSVLNTFVEGILNAFFYSVKNNEVTIKIEPSGFHRDFKNNIDQTINMSSNVAIDGVTPITDIQPIEFGLHSKTVTFIADFEVENDSDSKTFAPGVDTLHMTIPLSVEGSEGFDGLEDQVSPYLSSNADTTVGLVQLLWPNNTGKDQLIEFDYTIDGYVNVSGGGNISGGSVTLPTSLQIRIGSTYDNAFAEGGVYYIKPVFSKVYTNGVVSVDLSESFNPTYNVPSGHNVYLSFVIAGIPTDSGSPFPWSVETHFNKFSFKLKNLNIADPSTATGYYIYEMLRKMCESMTGQIDCFRSNFFGREDLGYESDGCGAWTTITNGLNIRNMFDKNGNRFPVNVVFSELFQDLSSIYCLGMRVEKENGLDVVRIEPAEYFYNASTIKTFFNVSDLTRTPATDLMFSKFSTGYDKWNLNVSGINALDEVNAQRVYSLPVKKANKVLERKTRLIGSGYLIEETRRLQYKDYLTTDFETDNDLFIICMNRTTVVSDKYSRPAVDTMYLPGKVSERNEDFTDVKNVLDPDSIYNLRISPARMAANWYSFISPSFWKAANQKLLFVSGTGNFLESDTIGHCSNITSVAQNQNIENEDITGTKAIYNPEYLAFTTPISFQNYRDITSNTERAIGVSCSSQGQFIGFIKEMKYNPTTDGGVASFKLLSGSCITGDFNNDFNKDFFVGNCN